MKRTCLAKNRANFDIIESFFQEDPCMDLASRLIWSWQNSTEAVFLSNRKVQFWISVIWQVFSFWFTVKWEKYFSVKSSWEVHWIVMFQKDAVCRSAYVIYEWYLLDLGMLDFLWIPSQSSSRASQSSSSDSYFPEIKVENLFLENNLLYYVIS